MLTPHKLFAALLLTTPLLLGLPAQGQTRVVLSNDNNALGVKGRTFELLKAEIERRLGDKAKVELHHSGTLFDQQTQVQGLQLGSANMIAPEPGTFAPLANKINALFLPFLLSTPAEIREAMDDPVVRSAFIPDLERKNITVVNIWLNGPRDFSNRGPKPILVPDDLRGVKMRVQAIPVSLATMKTLGANVVAMDWTQVPTALQQGVIDAIEPTPNALVGAGLPEMIGQTSRVGYQYSFYFVAVNRRWWTGLPPDIRTGIQAALDVATKWNWDNTEKENAEAYAKVRVLGKRVYELDDAQRALWRTAVQPVWKEFGDSLVDAKVMARLREISETKR